MPAASDLMLMPYCSPEEGRGRAVLGGDSGAALGVDCTGPRRDWKSFARLRDLTCLLPHRNRYKMPQSGLVTFAKTLRFPEAHFSEKFSQPVLLQGFADKNRGTAALVGTALALYG